MNKAEITSCQCGWKPTYPIKSGERCKLFWCKGCQQWRTYCEGAHPGDECDHCWAAAR